MDAEERKAKEEEYDYLVYLHNSKVKRNRLEWRVGKYVHRFSPIWIGLILARLLAIATGETTLFPFWEMAIASLHLAVFLYLDHSTDMRAVLIRKDREKLVALSRELGIDSGLED